MMLNIHFLRTGLFLCISGVAALSSVLSSAATPLAVTLYMPDNLDAKGQKIPISLKDAALFRYFEQEAQLQFSIVTVPWKRAQLEVMRGNGIIYGFSKSKERLDHYRFSKPVTTLSIWAFSYGEANAELSNLKGRTVLSGLGLSHGVEYENARNKVFTVKEVVLSDQDRVRKLLTNQTYVMLFSFPEQSSREQVRHSFNHKFIPELHDAQLDNRNFEVSANPMFYDTIHFASGKGHLDEVLDKIDSAILKGMANGSLAKLTR
jgi:polar amino acid transport system substrate-binding protein